MAYTARQIHCLEAMGIVPWVSRSSAAESINESHPAEDNLLAQRPLAKLPEPPNSESLPPDQWLASQALSVFSHRGARLSSLGASSAMVVVVSVVSDPSVDKAPLDSRAAQLLDLMMRAIDISRAQFCTCAIGKPGVTSSAEGPMLSSVCSSSTRAILLLDPSPVQPVQFSVAINNATLPVWSLLHPDSLLQNPEHKRHAWETLKALQRALV